MDGTRLNGRRWPWGWLTAAAVLVAAAYLVVGYVAASVFSQPPRPASVVAPDGFPDVDDLTLTTEDGVRLAAWWAPASPGSGTAILVHGYGDSRVAEYVTTTLPLYHQAGWNVLALDLRGHGESEATHSTGGYREVLDVGAALSWLEERGASTDDVVLHGWSLGGTVAARAAAAYQPGGLITDSAMASLDTALRYGLPRSGLPLAFYPSVQLMGQAFFGHDVRSVEPAAELASMESPPPALIIHGRDDEEVLLEHAETLSRALPGAETWFVSGRGHVEAHQEPEYAARLNSFLNQLP